MSVCAEREGTDTESEANGGRPSQSFLYHSVNLLAAGDAGAAARSASSGNGALAHADWREASVRVPPPGTRSTSLADAQVSRAASAADEARDEPGAVHVPPGALGVGHSLLGTRSRLLLCTRLQCFHIYTVHINAQENYNTCTPICSQICGGEMNQSIHSLSESSRSVAFMLFVFMPPAANFWKSSSTSSNMVLRGSGWPLVCFEQIARLFTRLRIQYTLFTEYMCEMKQYSYYLLVSLLSY